jgi:effector-binding domain-containing protein
MKWIIISSLGLFLLFLAYTSWSTSKTPSPKYETLEKEGDFELRRYEPIFEARTMTVNQWQDGSSQGFRVLANYIFGGNETGQQISMTTPVKTMLQKDSMMMAFSMPPSISPENAPKPSSSKVNFVVIPERKVASITFGGFANQEEMEKKEKQLRSWISKKGLAIIGPAEYLRYNPPYQLVGRKNEVVIPIQ